MSMVIEHGGVYWVSFAPSVGHEYQGRRPAVVIQTDQSLAKTNLATVMPLTFQIGKPQSDDILVRADKGNGLYGDSLVKVHHIESFDQARFIKRVGTMDSAVMKRIQTYLRGHFGLP